MPCIVLCASGEFEKQEGFSRKYLKKKTKQNWEIHSKIVARKRCSVIFKVHVELQKVGGELKVRI